MSELARRFHMMSANTLAGDSVRNSAGEDLGRINDFMIDLDNGHIVYAVPPRGAVDRRLAGSGGAAHHDRTAPDRDRVPGRRRSVVHRARVSKHEGRY